MAREKVSVVLDDGNTEIETTKEGWTKEEVKDLPVLFAGWAPKSAAHMSIGFGLAMACKDKVEGAYLGDYEGIPVFDPAAIFEEMKSVFIDKYELDIPKVRVATSRTGARKELVALSKELVENKELLDMLKATNPALYDKVVKSATQ